jgi:SH3-like domain-containing protein
MRSICLLSAALAVLILAAGGCTLRSREEGACPTPQRRASPSGFCVPRWLSLKSNEVLARRGPGFDYPALFTYRARGLPVQVVAETEEWRRVCVPEGGAVWVHKSMVDGRRMVMSPPGTPLVMRVSPDLRAHQAALMNPSALASLERCERGWCRVAAGGVSGWAPQGQLWGANEAPQCR